MAKPVATFAISTTGCEWNLDFNLQLYALGTVTIVLNNIQEDWMHLLEAIDTVRQGRDNTISIICMAAGKSVYHQMLRAGEFKLHSNPQP